MEDIDASAGGALDVRLVEMLKLRVSHMNGCAYSVRMHSEGLARAGARPEIIAALARPVKLMRVGLITGGEAAALRLAEVLTDPPRGLEIEARDVAGGQYSGKQVGSMIEVVAMTNAWNRVTRGTE